MVMSVAGPFRELFIWFAFTYAQVGKSVKDLNGLRLGRVKDIPVVDGSLRHQTQGLVTKPLPVHNILVHDSRLELLLCGQIENLDRSTLGFEGDDVAGPVHDGTVRVDRPLDNFIIVLQVDDNHLRLIIFAEFLTDTDEVIRF